MRKKSAAKCQHVHDGHCLIHTSLMATEGNFDITHKFRHVRYGHGADLYAKYGFKLLQAFFSFEEKC